MSHTGSIDDNAIVWVNLGKSYGWWPAQVQDCENRMRMKEHTLRHFKFEGEEEYQYPDTVSTSEYKCTFVKFFDDDSKEWLKINDERRIKKYSFKDKLKLIKAGFKNLDETKKAGLGGVNLRLAQFYKDVEMAEVMTDNDARVGDILSRYEVMETEDHVSDQINEDRNTAEDKTIYLGEDTPSGSKAGQTKKSKDVLKEIKNGSVKKAKRKPVKKVKLK